MTDEQFSTVMKLLLSKPERSSRFSRSDLPDPSAFPAAQTVNLTKEQMVEFRNQYGTMLGVLSVLADRDPKELCLLDMMELLSKWRRMKEELKILKGGA